MKKMLLIGLTSLLLVGAHADEGAAKIPFPENYQTTFTNYLSLDRVQNPDQVIRLFANDTAMAGPDADGKLPYGSVIVAEVYKARTDAEGNVVTSELLNRRIREHMVLIGVMQREKGWGLEHEPKFQNENWEFAAFKPDGTIAAKDINACRECHAPLEKTHHLFSYEHLIPPAP